MDINIAPIKNYEGKEIPINCEVNIAGMPVMILRYWSP